MYVTVGVVPFRVPGRLSVIVTVGGVRSAGAYACEAWGAAVLALPAASVAAAAGTLTVNVPEPAGGVMRAVYTAPLPLTVPTLAPGETTMSVESKPVTDSLKVKVKLTGPFAAPGVLSVIATVGASVSMPCEPLPVAALTLPSTSAKRLPATETPTVPEATPAVGVTVIV